MTRTLKAALVAACLLALSAPAVATSRIKDLANFEGVRENQLIGYGLVVGLNGSGDTLQNIPFTKQSIQAMLERMGVNIRGAQIRTGNVAAAGATSASTHAATSAAAVSVLGIPCSPKRFGPASSIANRMPTEDFAIRL